MKFDFTTEDEKPARVEGQYLEAGKYRVDVSGWRRANLDNGTEYFEIEFACVESGKRHFEKWFLTEGSLWRFRRDMKAAGIRTLDLDDIKGVDRTLKARKYDIELKAKPPYKGKVYQEIKSIKSVDTVAAPVQSADEEIPF